MGATLTRPRARGTARSGCVRERGPQWQGPGQAWKIYIRPPSQVCMRRDAFGCVRVLRGDIGAATPAALHRCRAEQAAEGMITPVNWFDSPFGSAPSMGVCV